MRTIVACVLLAAAVTVPGIVVAATASEGHSTALFSVTETPVAVGSSSSSSAVYGQTQMSPSMLLVSNALMRAFAAKGIQLRFVPAGDGTWEGFQSGSGRCLVDVVLSTHSAAPEPAFPACATRSTVADRIAITYSPPAARPTVEQALATLPG